MVVTMKKKMIFPQNDEDSVDSIFYWRRRHNEAVDKWARLDSLLLKIMRESEEKDRQIAFLKDSHDAIRELAYKTGVEEEREACAQLCYSRCPMDGTVSVEVELARAIRARGEV